MLEIGERQWRDRKLICAVNVQGLAACDKHVEIRTALEEFRQERCRCNNLLEVVEQEQEVPVLQIVVQALYRRQVRALSKSQHLGNGRKNQVGVADRSEWNNADTIRKSIHQVCCYLQA